MELPLTPYFMYGVEEACASEWVTLCMELPLTPYFMYGVEEACASECVTLCVELKKPVRLSDALASSTPCIYKVSHSDALYGKFT